jgi:hypothetical protein
MVNGKLIDKMNKLKASNNCQTFSHLDELGRAVFKDKRKFITHDKAVEMCKALNLKEGQIMKLVTYKCVECHKYHIGRNGHEISKKYRSKLRKVNDKRDVISFKVVGKVDLSKFPPK